MRYWKQGQRKGPLVGRSPLEGLRGHSWEMALFHFLNFLLPLSTQVMQKSVKGDHLCGSLQFGLDHRVHEHPQPSPDTTMHTHSLLMHSTGRRCKEPRSPKEGDVPDPVHMGSSACTVCIPHPASHSQTPSSARGSLLHHGPQRSAATPATAGVSCGSCFSPSSPTPRFHQDQQSCLGLMPLRPPAPSWSVSHVPPCPLSADLHWTLGKLIPQFSPHLPEACLFALLRHLKPPEVQRDQ